MTAPVTTTTPTAPAEAKPGRKVAEAAVSGDFAAVLAAVAGVAAPPAPAAETPVQPETPVGPDGESDDHGAAVVTPPAAGHVSGPFPAGSRPGATVTLPDQAAHAAPVRGEERLAAPEVPPAPLPETPAAIALPGASAALPATGASAAVPAMATPGHAAQPAGGPAGDAPAAGGLAVAPSGDASQPPPVAPDPVSPASAGPDAASAPATSGATATVDATTAGNRPPAGEASPRAHLAAGWGDGPVPRPETPAPNRSESLAPKGERRPSDGEIGTNTVATPAVASAPQATAPLSGPASAGTPGAAPAPAVVDQVVEVIQPLIRMEDGSDEVILELRPADLGTVRVEVRVEHGVVHATLHADQDSTADLLRQSLPDLRTALAEAGLQPGDLGCGHGRNAGQGGASQDRPAWGRDPDRRPGTPAEPALTHRAADPRRSLDVLL